MAGWIRLHRSMMKKKSYFREPFTFDMAWIDLLLLANYIPTIIYKRKQSIVLERGSLAFSEKALAKRWKWSRKKVDNFLKDLKKEHQISYAKNHLTTIISINNYSFYQGENSKRTSEFEKEHLNLEIGTSECEIGTSENIVEKPDFLSEIADNPTIYDNEKNTKEHLKPELEHLNTEKGTHYNNIINNNKNIYMEANNQPEPQDPKNQNPSKKGKRGAGGHFNPEDVDNFINDVRLRAKYKQWLEYRKSKGKPVSTYAAKEHFDLLLSVPVDQAIEIISRSINSDWQGLFPIKGSQYPASNQPAEQTRPTAEKL